MNEVQAKYFGELSTRELYAILKARAEIFVVEQHIVYQDLDDRDFESLHVFIAGEDEVTAYFRAFVREPGVVQLGRVLTRHHGQGLGRRLLAGGMALVEEKFQPRKIYLESQCQAQGFYEQAGFTVCSGEFFEEGIRHVGMERIINGA